MKKIFIVVFIIVSFAIINAGEKLKIAYMICVSREDTLNRFLPLTKYLEEKTGQKFEVVLFDAEDLNKIMKEKKPEFIHSNSLLYIIANKQFKSQLLVTEEKEITGLETASVIFSRAGSGIKTLKDLKGKKMIFGPMFSPSGYLASYYTLLINDIDPENDLAFYSIPWGSYKHEKVLYGVYYQAFDVGSARLGDIEEMVEKKIFEKNDFNIIAISEKMPYCTFYSNEWTDIKLVQKVKNALLDLTPENYAKVNNEYLNVTKAAQIKGYKVINDSDYNIVRKMANKIKLIPYTSD